MSDIPSSLQAEVVLRAGNTLHIFGWWHAGIGQFVLRQSFSRR